MAFKRLEARHYMAIKYLAQPNHGGLTMEQIGEKCGVSRKSLYQWKKDELFQRELKKEMRRLVGDRIPDVIEAMFKAAIEDRSGKHAELLLKTYGDMLTDDVRVEQTVKGEVTTDVSALKARAADIMAKYGAKDKAEDEAEGESEDGDEGAQGDGNDDDTEA